MKHALFDLAALALMLAGLGRWEAGRLARPLQVAWVTAFALLAAVRAWDLARIARDNIAQVPLWDFRVFWMVGRAAVSGRDVYDPASYAALGAALNPAHDPVFTAIAVGVGLPYPPPALYLFYPLGWFDLKTALVGWDAALFAALALAAVLLWRRFFARDGVAGLLAAALLLMLLPQTGQTLALAQVNFFALCLLVAFWGAVAPWRAGLWLAPLVILRPFMLVLALAEAPSLRRTLALLAAWAAGTAVLFAVAFPLAGAHAMATYVHSNPSGRYPQSFFTGNRSLYEFFAARDPARGGHFSLAAHPAFLVCAIVLLAAAVVVARRARPERRGLVRAMFLALGLLLYPTTGPHYAVLLVVPLCEVWRARDRVGLGSAGAIAAVLINYALLRIGDGAATIGIVAALDVLLCAALALRHAREDAASPS